MLRIVSLLILLATSIAGAEPSGRVGIAMVPHMPGKGDDAEQLLSTYAGQLAGVDRIYTPDSPAQMFETLLKQKKLGRQVNLLFIMGHGSAANPSVSFANGVLLPSDVDLPKLRKDLAMYERIFKERTQSGDDTSVAGEQVAKLTKSIKNLEEVGDALAKDAQVVLINCSAAATPKGKEFVKNLGEVLLGKRGGSIIASKKDVSITVVSNRLDKLAGLWATGSWLEIGEIFDGGAWVKTPVKPQARGKVKIVRVDGDIEFFVGGVKATKDAVIPIGSELTIRALAVAPTGRRTQWRTFKAPKNTTLVDKKSDYHMHYKTAGQGDTDWNVAKETYRWSVSGGASNAASASGEHKAVEGDVSTIVVDKAGTVTANVEGTVEWKGASTRLNGTREDKATDLAKGTIELSVTP